MIIQSQGENASFSQGDSLWYKDAVIYQLHVRTFCDSNGDGIGDFRGLTSKLDYLQDLGVTAVWLLPFYPSPLKDDGYDISDYMGIHPDYGNLRDFKIFLREAHRRGLKVITELVINHTSDQHTWFQRARRAEKQSRWRRHYVWSDTPERYKEARIIFQDFENFNWTWDPVAKSYYWHRFYSHQPDLNYDNPQVQKAILRALKFWLKIGVDGLRLDAVPYLYEREGTNCENLPETHDFLKRLRAEVEDQFEDRMFLGEANQWPEDTANYFGQGDECHMAFHFPLMPRLFMALHMEDSFPISDIVEQTPSVPDSCQWGLFLRNHDELTLEMVTDEERDYMYRVYAQDPQMRVNLGIRRRLAPLLGNHRRRFELMKGLLFSLPGTPIIYYGDEIGMGDNIYLGDRNGVRTPMQWSGDRNAGFSDANPQKLYLPVIIDPEYHYEVVNVEAQQQNRHSLLWWMKRLIGLRKNFKAFGRGTIEMLQPKNPKIIAFIRHYKEEHILVAANLSRFVQFAELNLSDFEGWVPVEIFGRSAFPAVGPRPYFLTLGPHSFYWFYLLPEHLSYESTEISGQYEEWPFLKTPNRWDDIFKGNKISSLEQILPGYLRKHRWFGGKARRIKSTGVEDVLTFSHIRPWGYILLVKVEYLTDAEEVYMLPLTYSKGEEGERVAREHPDAVLARLEVGETGEQGFMYDGAVNPEFCRGLIRSMAGRSRAKGNSGTIYASRTRSFRDLYDPHGEPLEAFPVKAEQSNTSVVMGDKFIVKMVRRVGEGVNPHLEVGHFLTNKGFPYVPRLAGAVEYKNGRKEPRTLAILEGFVPNQGDAWRYTEELLGLYFEDILAKRPEKENNWKTGDSVLKSITNPHPEVRELIGPYLESARLLGQRTGELHLTLASSEDPLFSPERFTKLYQRSLYQSMRTLARQVYKSLENQLEALPAGIRNEIMPVEELQKKTLERLGYIINSKVTAMRIRCHGDYHLGQVLYTGKDFVIIDFEGEPARPISERRIKRSPLKDVAGMLRSFHYAVYSSLFAQKEQGLAHAEDIPYLEYWANFWYMWVSRIFLGAYQEVSAPGGFLPESGQEMVDLLDIYLLEKAVYELGYELNNRPDWVKIPLKGINQILSQQN